MAKTFNVNELVPYKFRYVEFTDLADNTVIARLTQLEDATLKTAAENDSVKDAMGTEIMKLYKAKTAQFTASNSLFSTDLYAVQMGSAKETASAEHKILVPADETLTVAGGKATLVGTPKGEIRTVYVLRNNNIAQKLTANATASEGKFAISDKQISVDTTTVPDGSKIYVEYNKEVDSNAVKVTNKANNFPKVTGFKASLFFKDPCTEEEILGYIVSPKAKIDPSSIETAFKFDGKHPFTVDLFKSYCDENDELFSFIIAE